MRQSLATPLIRTDQRSGPPPAARAFVRDAHHTDATEQRRASRKTLIFVLARIKSGSTDELCRVRNISESGFGIEASTALRQGDPITISFPDRQFAGHIRWSRHPFSGLHTRREICPETLIEEYSTSADRLDWEHRYLSMLGLELQRSVSHSEPGSSIDSNRLRQKFSYALRAHLKYEDWAIYPKLLRHPSSIVSASAARLKMDLGKLEEHHSDYTRRWITKAPQDHWPDYCRETSMLVDAVKQRIHQEDTHLYGPLALASSNSDEK